MGRKRNEDGSADEVTLRGARHLLSHPDATGFDLNESGLLPGALDPPQALLVEPIDPDRLDLVEEFRARPLGPHSLELRHLLWSLRARWPAGRYVLRLSAAGGWEGVHLIGARRPRGEPVPGPVWETLEDAEWGIFTLRWRDHTGRVLPAQRRPP